LNFRIGGNLTAAITDYLSGTLTLVTPDPHPEVYMIAGQLLFPFQLTNYSLAVDYAIQNINQQYGLDVSVSAFYL
jgi:hypothetical protein